MSTETRVVRLLFDRSPEFGSREHYFHFMWGYLLPALRQILDETRTDVVFEFESCGPMMNPRIREVCEQLEIPYHLGIRASMRSSDSDVVEQSVPRWDCWLRSPEPTRVALASKLHRAGTPDPVLEAMDDVISRLLAAAGCEPEYSSRVDAAEESEPSARGAWLLLKRSEEHPFYGPEGAAEKKNYGVGRRAIANLDVFANQLTAQGFPIHVYEAGRDSLVQQIRTFRLADVVIGVRGAEFANVAWMRPRTTALMLSTAIRVPHHLIDGLAATRGVQLKLIPVDSDYPEVSAHDILSALAPAAALPRVGSRRSVA